MDLCVFSPLTSVFSTSPSPPGIQSNAAANLSSLTVSTLHHGSNTSATVIRWTATFFLYLNEVFYSPHPYCKQRCTSGFLKYFILSRLFHEECTFLTDIRGLGCICSFSHTNIQQSSRLSAQCPRKTSMNLAFK